jgi:hypothetical protein
MRDGGDLLVIMEEASDVPEWIFDAIDSLGSSRCELIGAPIRFQGGCMMGDEIQDANVIRIWQELGEDDRPQSPQKWLAHVGPIDLGKQATGTNPVEALIALTMVCHNERWPFDLGWQPEAARVKARFTPPTPPERPTPTAGAVNPSVPFSEAKPAAAGPFPTPAPDITPKS